MPSNSLPNEKKKWSIKKKARHYFARPLLVLAYATGAMSLFARLRKHQGAIVLMYHSIAGDPHRNFIDPANHVPPEIFERQMHFLARHRKVISFNELVKTLQEGKTPVDGTLVITFDDGYLDNLTIAAPILERYKLPATIFLPTGYIDRGENQWIDQAYTAFKYRSRSQLVWGEEASLRFKLDDPCQFLAAYRAISAELLKANSETRKLRLGDLCEQLQPATRSPRLTMTWDDVGTLVGRYPRFEIGAHTLEHTDLTSVDEEQANSELMDCIQWIKDKTNIKPRYFSFCYGRTSASLRHLAASAGYEAACGGDGLDPVIVGTADRYRLPRVAAPPAMQRFDLLTNSANSGIWRTLGR